MLETMSDYISIYVLLGMILFGLYLLFIITDKNHEKAVEGRMNRYYSYLDPMEDDGEDKDDPYYE